MYQHITVSSQTSEDPLPFDIHLDHEEHIYNGSHTIMEVEKRTRIKTTCPFCFTKFPFDEQTCSFLICIKGSEHRKVNIIGTNKSISYIGGTSVGQFEVNRFPYAETIQNVSSCSSSNGFKFTVELRRRPLNGIIQIIIPSLILWLVAVLTLQVSIDDLTNRTRTSVTALLVLVTLFGAITNKDDFPKTSEFKYIDVWFLWYLTNIFIIIGHHVIVHKLSLASDNAMMRSNMPPLMSMDDDAKIEKLSSTCLGKKKLINSFVNVFILFLTLGFNIVYFLFSR